uniref:Protein transport protein Sec24C n=1 Tax=Panagrellus redivivus TaxID=6233 RepID=A0A7E4VFY4_PANRE
MQNNAYPQPMGPFPGAQQQSRPPFPVKQAPSQQSFPQAAPPAPFPQAVKPMQTPVVSPFQQTGFSGSQAPVYGGQPSRSPFPGAGFANSSPAPPQQQQQQPSPFPQATPATSAQFPSPFQPPAANVASSMPPQGGQPGFPSAPFPQAVQQQQPKPAPFPQASQYGGYPQSSAPQQQQYNAAPSKSLTQVSQPIPQPQGGNPPGFPPLPGQNAVPNANQPQPLSNQFQQPPAGNRVPQLPQAQQIPPSQQFQQPLSNGYAGGAFPQQNNINGQQQANNLNQMNNQFQQFGFGTGANVQAQPRYLDLCTERNLWGYGLEDNKTILPSSVCNNTLPNNTAIFRCSVSAIPESADLVKKCRLPLGLTLHPFRDQRNLHILQTTIVRCRYCRAYINPYVYMSDSRHWRCNICYRSNDLPDDFCYDRERRSYGDPSGRPEIQNTTVEFIATSDYMLRPPQPACYFFVLDTSAQAVNSKYLHILSEQLTICLDQLPGSEDALIGFMCVDSSLHYFQFNDGESSPRHLIVSDVDEPFLPADNGLFVKLKQFREPIRSFIQSLPDIFEGDNRPTSNCVGTAVQSVFDLINEIGGRVSVFQASLPDIGAGALKARDPNDRRPQSFGPSTDYYKRLALESTGKQISYDLFVLGHKSIDLATLAEMCKVSGGAVYHFPNYHSLHNIPQTKRFEKQLNRYLTRKIGFEAVLRIRCSRGLSLHSFYGNFFVRSTDLLALPTVSPDAALGAQIQVDENLSGQQTVCFQAALLYTSSKGDRRIRVHTMCLPVCSEFGTLFEQFDVHASVSLLSKMASDRAMSGGDLADCREGIVNAAVDALGSYNRSVGLRDNVIYAPFNGQLKFFVVYVLGLLKHKTFSSASSSGLTTDDQVAMMLLFRNAPIEVILNEVYPVLFPIHTLQPEVEGLPQRLPLTYERVNSDGIYLLDTGNYVYLYVCSTASPQVIEALFGVQSYSQIDEDFTIQQLPNPFSERFFALLRAIQKLRANYFAPLITIREDSQRRSLFTSRLVEDRTENSHSYIEFLHHVRHEMQR